MHRSTKTFFLVIAFVTLSSHELFLKSDSHFLSPNSTSEIYLLNGTFDKSENSITRDRIINAKIIGPDYLYEPTDGDYSDENNITYLKFKTGETGSYVAGISTLPRMLEMTASDFNAYLDHEGLANTLADRKKDGSIEKGAKEKYSKHVKSLLQVGDQRTDHYMAQLNYPIEFIPLNNPFAMKVGDSISFQLLSSGKPLANQTVHYSTSVPGKDAHENESSTQTNEEGVLTISPDKAGKWYVATIHMVKSTEKGVDYESNWATLTFEIK
ncbi:DUF4198 domain-containing protein [Costertonia aggregata]|uniref:DUF4198 domain-containing protein n=1 Tax=Costertonia aggregata TaxID=343403 RepID=A0A7H9ASE5_9FLAO|nr:DUF4198 domain-containing protein [Costertonia aggregata]QLG46374.1 DUF4198 domain-containing protein [Costertonia aggregata]